MSVGVDTVTELAEPLPMRMPAVSRHLKVLEHAGLIARGREAQWRPCRITAAPLKGVADWLSHYQRFWTESFEHLDEYLRDAQKKEKNRGHGKHHAKRRA